MRTVKIVVVTRAGLSRAQHAMRSMVPGVPIGHLNEALASGLGFGSHAALLARLDRSTQFSAVFEADLAWTRLQELGHEFEVKPDVAAPMRELMAAGASLVGDSVLLTALLGFRNIISVHVDGDGRLMFGTKDGFLMLPDLQTSVDAKHALAMKLAADCGVPTQDTGERYRLQGILPNGMEFEYSGYTQANTSLDIHKGDAYTVMLCQDRLGPDPKWPAEMGPEPLVYPGA